MIGANTKCATMNELEKEYGLPESMCLAHNCHLKEKCDRFTRKKRPEGDAFQNFSPFKKGELKGKCFFFKSNEGKI